MRRTNAVDQATRLARASYHLFGQGDMQSRVEVYFEAVEITAQHVFGESGDYVDAVVHFDFRYPDCRVDTNCTATVWYRLEPNDADLIEVTVPATHQCPAYGSSLLRAIAAYYRQRVGATGSVIRIGKKGASKLIVGVPMQSSACAEFDADVQGAA